MPAPLRLRVFQHVPHENLGSLEPFFTARGAEIAYTRLFAGELPPDPAACDFLIVLGGPMNVYEEEKYPWLASEKKAIRAALDAGKPVLGLCLGAQLMAVALGGAVTRNAHREIGWWPVEQLPAARGKDGNDGKGGPGKHWAASCFPDRFTTFHWHGDTFSIPPGATPLFRSEGCANQGFAWRDRAVALQFHPEITPEAIAAWIAESLAEGGGDLAPGTYVQDAAAMRGMPEDFAGNNLWMGTLCDRMLRPAPASATASATGSAPEPRTPDHPVIFFDGYCGLCNGFVDFMMARDRPGPREGGGAAFRFAPLQGETAAARVPDDAVPYALPGAEAIAPRSLVLWENGAVHRKSEAVLRAVSALGGAWRLAGLLRVIPRFLRDFVYDGIARNRYKWFGKREACRLPGPGEREKFLP